MIVAIHQPNLFPWLGYFNKIYKSDIFVFLDHVEMNPRTAIYPKRVKLIVNKQEYWLTCNLKSEGEKIFYPINQMVIDNPTRQKDKHLKTIELNYKKAQHYEEVLPHIEGFYNHPSIYIAERNILFINSICKQLNIETKKVLSSEMNTSTSSNQLLIDIVKQLNATGYMPGGGADGYQQDEMFKENGITLKPQNFSHPQYKQFTSSSFIPGLSVLDALMNLGFNETEQLIKNA